MDSLFSKIIKAGTTTYFMDVKEAKNNKKYLTVTASQMAKEGEKKFLNRRVVVFSDVAEGILTAVKEAGKIAANEGEFTQKLKTGKITYFVDVKSAKNDTRYISITETQPSKEDPKKFTRKNITIFDNVAHDFTNALEEVIGHLK
jgi:Protein of unknown function (DUF3276)